MVASRDCVWRRDVAAQIECESKSCKQLIIFQFQVLRSRRFHFVPDRVNLHRPTVLGRARRDKLGVRRGVAARVEFESKV
jgi:hypothetical protein